MAAIRRKRLGRSQLRNIWYPLDEVAEFELIRTSNVGLGVVPADFKRYANETFLPLGKVVTTFEEVYGSNPELSWLYATLLDAVDRLAYPATFRDMSRTWACVQRFALYTFAWFDWNVTFMQTYRAPSLVRIFEPIPFDEWMGCFTASTALASRLAKATIPVWLMRPIENFSGDEVIERAVVFTEPLANIENVQGALTSHVSADDIRCISPAGDEHITWINRMAIRYLDQASVVSNASLSTDEGPSAHAVSDVKRDASEQVRQTPSSSIKRFSPCTYS